MVECEACGQTLTKKEDRFNPKTAEVGMAYLDVGEGVSWIFVECVNGKFEGLVSGKYFGTEDISYAEKWLMPIPDRNIAVEDVITLLAQMIKECRK